MYLSVLGLLAQVPLVVSQTFTKCNPTVSTCPADVGLDYGGYVVDFTQNADPANWASIGTGSISYSSSGAAFTISQKGDAPTIASSWYIFFGRAEVHLRAAPGTGIVSAVVLESDDLDEIDWEWIGGNSIEVQTNYFGKGNTTTYDRGGKTAVADTQGVTHNYTIDWTTAAITWYVDSVAVRTLRYADAVGGKNFPQTPCRLKLGIWAGGDSGNPNGTITWAGGVTDYSKGPFTMYVERVAITNANPAASYVYGDLSGDWRSISCSDKPVDHIVTVNSGSEVGLWSRNRSGPAGSVELGGGAGFKSAKTEAKTGEGRSVGKSRLGMYLALSLGAILV